MHNGAFRVCVLARSHVVDHRHTYVYRKTRRERGRAFLPSHYLLLALSLSSPFLVSLALLSLPLSIYLSFLHPSSTDHVREGILSSFYSLSRPVIVDTMARNDCFTPPLARELGNKLATGLISLSRSMTAPPRLRRQGLMSERKGGGGFRDPKTPVEIVSPGAPQAPLARSHAKCGFVKNRSIPIKAKARW